MLETCDENFKQNLTRFDRETSKKAGGVKFIRKCKRVFRSNLLVVDLETIIVADRVVPIEGRDGPMAANCTTHVKIRGAIIL